MRKLIAAILLLGAMLFLPLLAMAETAVTSFYPIYVFAANLTDGIEGIELYNLAAPGTGCLHDYQLQTGDMKTLAGADVFLVNGAGMESYLAHVYEAFPNLPVVVASEGIPLLDEENQLLEGDHSHDDHDDHDHDHGEVNAHVWLDVKNAQAMVTNLCEGLCQAWPRHREALEANRDRYLAQLQQLDDDLHAGLDNLPKKDIITFHEAFPYFANAYGLNVVGVVNREPGDALSPAQLSRLVKTVVDLGAPPLFTEPQYADMAARTISQETGAPIYQLDPVVTGPEGAADAKGQYETAMRENMAVLQQALGQ
ncbi:MAG: metal ABC transporter substrate-binding protein [Clostridia bacterium]|nr:metal ABC transporter substrate-binding protein [Clostridia bacterium]